MITEKHTISIRKREWVIASVNSFCCVLGPKGPKGAIIAFVNNWRIPKANVMVLGSRKVGDVKAFGVHFTFLVCSFFLMLNDLPFKGDSSYLFGTELLRTPADRCKHIH